ncbi:hypothetical protein EDC01DRAFT_754011 [Geopyxis carbonaria]|nr:hypothetical protein EDC01DRAFT_754011 [Geopyxis carbonaria]
MILFLACHDINQRFWHARNFIFRPETPWPKMQRLVSQYNDVRIWDLCTSHRSALLSPLQLFLCSDPIGATRFPFFFPFFPRPPTPPRPPPNPLPTPKTMGLLKTYRILKRWARNPGSSLVPLLPVLLREFGKQRDEHVRAWEAEQAAWAEYQKAAEAQRAEEEAARARWCAKQGGGGVRLVDPEPPLQATSGRKRSTYHDDGAPNWERLW